MTTDNHKDSNTISNNLMSKNNQNDANIMIISNITIPNKMNETTISNINNSKNFFYQIPNEIDEIEEETKQEDYFDYDNYFIENVI